MMIDLQQVFAAVAATAASRQCWICRQHLHGLSGSRRFCSWQRKLSWLVDAVPCRLPCRLRLLLLPLQGSCRLLGCLLLRPCCRLLGRTLARPSSMRAMTGSRLNALGTVYVVIAKSSAAAAKQATRLASRPEPEVACMARGSGSREAIT